MWISLVYYAKTTGDQADPSRDLLSGLQHVKEHRRDLYRKLRLGELSETHTLVAQTTETDLNKIFDQFQDGPDAELSHRLNLSHTSMSVGDIVIQRDEMPDGDRVFFYDHLSGWKELW